MACQQPLRQCDLKDGDRFRFVVGPDGELSESVYVNLTDPEVCPAGFGAALEGGVRRVLTTGEGLVVLVRKGDR